MNGHPSDTDLREFVGHSLAAERLIEIDDHLSACESCRQRASSIGHASARLVEMATDVFALESHLSEAQLERFVAGGLSSEERARLARHVADCDTCGREVNDLQRWTSARPTRSPRWYLAAAVAVVLLVLTPFALMRWLPGTSRATDASITGIDLLPGDQQARVKAALQAGVAELPASVTEMMQGAEVLMGTTGAQSFRLTAPLATITVSDRPTFRWEAFSGAEEYTVAVLDVNLQPVAGPVTLADTSWTPAQPLARGRSYVWQVTGRRGATSVTVPAPPAPLARFSVLDGQTATLFERISRAEPDAHLLLGILLAQAGARQEAEVHLRQVPETDAFAQVARRTLAQLEAVAVAR